MDEESKRLRSMWKSEEKKKALKAVEDREASLGAVYEGNDPVDDAVQSDWQKLVALCRLRFPPHLAAKFNLKPVQRVVAIAYSIGWPIEKIATSAGIHRNTVTRWLKDDLVEEFTKAFQYHTGSRDSREVIEGEQYNSVLVLKELRDDPQVSASTRKEIAMWLFEQIHGKAKETKEIKGTNLRDLTEQLKKAAVEEGVSDEDLI